MPELIAGAWIHVPIITINDPVNMPARRPNLSLVGPVKKTAAREPMLYMAKTSPVEEPSTDIWK